jgi:hypothetical protein
MQGRNMSSFHCNHDGTLPFSMVCLVCPGEGNSFLVSSGLCPCASFLFWPYLVSSIGCRLPVHTWALKCIAPFMMSDAVCCSLRGSPNINPVSHRNKYSH